MRVCSQCGKENVAHTPRFPDLCPHEYEDIIAGLKKRLKDANRGVNETIAKAVKSRNETINRRNVQIADLLFRLKKAESE